jgi:hypothetical protein
LLTTIDADTGATAASVASIDGKTLGAPLASFTDSAGSTNATNVKNAAGRLFSIVATNINAAIRYLKIYNLAAAPNVGVDVPVMTIPIPATGSAVVNLGQLGVTFSVGISFALTTLGTNADATAVAANEIKSVSLICNHKKKIS